ncbi:hypothetical protein FHG87_001884 [Trinorchestia longiramus]|nr:hypothetical protein FHG87_001884 [Trinorchestia longiramus]
MEVKVYLALVMVWATAAVTAMPHSFDVAVDDIDVLEQVLPILRAARSLNMPIDEIVVAESSPVEQKSYDPYHTPHKSHGDHVDYGAYTGKHGAFGWYTDHPVLVQYKPYH